MMTLNKNHFSSLFILLAITLASCGFHLKKSVEIPSHVGPVSISGIGKFSGIYKAIENTLRQSDIQIVDSGTHNISLSQIRNERRVLSVGSDGKVAEYELFQSLTFQVSDSSGTVTIGPQTFTTTSFYSVSSTDVLGKSLEEDDLKRRMEEKLVGQMFRYIANLIK